MTPITYRSIDVNGNGAATTFILAAFSGPITLLQLDPSARRRARVRR